MPQRVSKRVDLSRISPTVRRDERMRLQTPRTIVPPPGLFAPEYTDRTRIPHVNTGLFDFPEAVPRARARSPRQTDQPRQPMLMDQNVMAYVRNQATPPMQTEMGREGAAAAQQLLNR